MALLTTVLLTMDESERPSVQSGTADESRGQSCGIWEGPRAMSIRVGIKSTNSTRAEEADASTPAATVVSIAVKGSNAMSSAEAKSTLLSSAHANRTAVSRANVSSASVVVHMHSLAHAHAHTPNISQHLNAHVNAHAHGCSRHPSKPWYRVSSAVVSSAIVSSAVASSAIVSSAVVSSAVE